jgi:serine/threonine protein kinase
MSPTTPCRVLGISTWYTIPWETSRMQFVSVAKRGKRSARVPLQAESKAANRTSFSELQVIELFQDMVNALTDCHQRGIIHRDIKPANSEFPRVVASTASSSDTFRVFLDTKKVENPGFGNRTRIVGFLGDFGIVKLTRASILHVETRTSTVIGSEPYMPPVRWDETPFLREAATNTSDPGGFQKDYQRSR